MSGDGIFLAPFRDEGRSPPPPCTGLAVATALMGSRPGDNGRSGVGAAFTEELVARRKAEFDVGLLTDLDRKSGLASKGILKCINCFSCSLRSILMCAGAAISYIGLLIGRGSMLTDLGVGIILALIFRA